MYCAEGWAFEALTLISTLISVEALAVQTICASFGCFLFFVASGFRDSSSILVGNSIGKGSARDALDYAQYCQKLVILIFTPLSISLLLFRNIYTNLLTSNE